MFSRRMITLITAGLLILTPIAWHINHIPVAQSPSSSIDKRADLGREKSSPTGASGHKNTHIAQAGHGGRLGNVPAPYLPSTQGDPTLASSLPVGPLMIAERLPEGTGEIHLTLESAGESYCPTPMSLMLHKNYGLERMQILANGIVERGLQTITYRDLLNLIREGRCPNEKTIIVSLDDYLTSNDEPKLRQTISTFTDHGLVLVLGVVTQEPARPGAWGYLQDLHKLGIEIASHTIDHLDLAQLPEAELENQVSGSYHRICEGVGICPVSLILPFGSRDGRGRVLRACHAYAFVVGIAGGMEIGSEWPHYVGRSGPYVGSLDRTLKVLHMTFIQ